MTYKHRGVRTDISPNAERALLAQIQQTLSYKQSITYNLAPDPSGIVETTYGPLGAAHYNALYWRVEIPSLGPDQMAERISGADSFALFKATEVPQDLTISWKIWDVLQTSFGVIERVQMQLQTQLTGLLSGSRLFVPTMVIQPGNFIMQLNTSTISVWKPTNTPPMRGGGSGASAGGGPT